MSGPVTSAGGGIKFLFVSSSIVSWPRARTKPRYQRVLFLRPVVRIRRRLERDINFFFPVSGPAFRFRRYRAGMVPPPLAADAPVPMFEPLANFSSAGEKRISDRAPLRRFFRFRVTQTIARSAAADRHPLRWLNSRCFRAVPLSTATALRPITLPLPRRESVQAIELGTVAK